jgi:hypothetical protein
MRSHVQILAWIFIVTNTMGVLAGFLGFLAFLGLGLFAGVTGALEAIPIVGGLGAALFLIVIMFCIPGLAAGIGMLGYQPWARILAIILSILGIFAWPVGTLLGIYGLWVLFNAEAIRLFEGAGVKPY